METTIKADGKMVIKPEDNVDLRYLMDTLGLKKDGDEATAKFSVSETLGINSTPEIHITKQLTAGQEEKENGNSWKDFACN